MLLTCPHYKEKHTEAKWLRTDVRKNYKRYAMG